MLAYIVDMSQASSMCSQAPLTSLVHTVLCPTLEPPHDPATACPHVLGLIHMPPGSTHVTQSKSLSSFGVHPLTISHRTPCGFCFVEYYSHAEALACMPYISGTKLDERVTCCDLDLGYKEGRQYG